MISIIIPTHNRAKYLKNLLDNIFNLSSKISFEIVVVDNNSKDDTKIVVRSYGDKVKYVFEPNTAFTKARQTGAENAKGEIIVYLDDDVILDPGAFEEVEKLFSQNKNLAVVGGKILPHFEQQPSAWILDLQKSFNGLSLYDLGACVKEVHAIPGPFMAIRKSVFDLVGGFPPDTIGVETNTQKRTFKKLYIGPGDYGFCLLCRNAGYKVFYSHKIVVHHIIPPIRLTKEFWVSRMVGEGHVNAITAENMSGYKINKNNLQKFLKHYFKSKIFRFKVSKKEALLLPDEIWYKYYFSLMKMQSVLRKNKGLSQYLWELGYKGISDNNFDEILSKLPRSFRKLAL